MSRKSGGGDDLHLEGDADFSAARREVKQFNKLLADLGTTSSAVGKGVDKDALQMAASYKTLATSIASAARQEANLATAAERLKRAQQNTRAATASADLKTTQATTAAAVQPSVVSKSASDAEVANQRALLANERVLTEAVRRTNMERQQSNTDLLAGMQASRLAAATEDSQAATKIRYVQQARREQRDAANEQLKAVATQARQEASAASQARALERANLAAVRNDENEIIKQHMAAQQAYKESFGSNTRYALYDVSSTAAAVGAAIGSVGVAEIAVATQFETAFSSVQRAAELTGDDVGDIEDQFLDMSTKIQASFQEISQAATLGAQMDVPAASLADFSKTIVEFTSTTNASLDDTAQGFGRIANLLDVPTSKFENLGSSIYQAGIKSVATETEILSTSQQIAGAAAAYNFTADQVVGLGSAFASLAIAPEAARGSVTRIFGKIEQAVEAGGPALDKYAKLLGTTSDAAADLWKQDPSAFFSQLVAGLGKSDSLLQSLSDIGANDVRDVNLLQRLSKNSDLLAQSLKVSSDAYASGTDLSEAYGVQAATLSSRLQVLWQTVQAVAAKGGTVLIDGLVKPLVSLLQLVSDRFNDMPSWITAVIAVLALLAAGWLLVKAGTAAAMAAALALNAVVKNLGQNISLTGINLKSFNAIMRDTAKAAGVADMSVAGLSTRVKSLPQKAGAGLLSIGKGVGGVLGITAAFSVLDGVVQSIQKSMEGAGEKAEDYFGDTSGFAAAIDEDTKAYQAYLDKVNSAKSAKQPVPVDDTGTITTYTTKVKATSDATLTARDSTTLWLTAQQQVAGTTKTATDAVTNQTQALGTNSQEWLVNALSKQKGIIAVANDPTLSGEFEKLGGDIPSFIAAGLSANGENYISSLLDPAIDKATKDAQEKLAKLNGGDSSKATAAQTNTIYAEVKTLQTLKSELGDAGQATDNLVRGQKEAANATTFLGGKLQTTGDDADDTGDDMTTFADNVKAGFAGIQQSIDFGSAINDLNSGLATGSKDFDSFSSAGQTNLANLQSTIVATAQYGANMGLNVTDSLVPIFASLKSQGVDTTSLLHQLANDPIMYQAGIDFSGVEAGLKTMGKTATSITPGQQLINNLMNESAKAAKADAAGQKSDSAAKQDNAKKTKTLKDEISDLNTAFGVAYDRTFGKDEAMDAIASAWNDIKKKQKEATAQIPKYTQALKEAQEALKTAYSDSYLDSYTSLLSTDIDTIMAKLNETSAEDKITQSFIDLKQAISDAKDKLAELQADAKQLTADRAVLDFQMSVATANGNVLRQGEISASIDKNQSDQNQNAKDQASAQDTMSTATTGDTSAAISNRATLTSMVSGYTDYVQLLAKAGASQQDINKAITDSKTAFKAQGKALGYTDDQLTDYLSVFDSLQKSSDASNITAVAKATDAQATATSNVTEAQSDLDDATDSSTLSLKGNSAAAIANRSDLRDLASKYDDAATAILNSDLTKPEKLKALDALGEKFNIEATKVGYGKTDIEKYGSYIDTTLPAIIAKLPTSTALKADYSPAEAAIKEYKSDTKDGLASVPSNVTTNLSTKTDDSALKKYARGLKLIERINDLRDDAIKADAHGSKSDADAYSKKADQLSAQITAGNYLTGGFVPGSRGSRGDNTMGVLPDGSYVGLQGGEGIVTNQARQVYGDQMIKDINALNYKTGSTNTQAPMVNVTIPGDMMAYLSAEDRQMFMSLATRPSILEADGVAFARVVKSGLKDIAFNGG